MASKSALVASTEVVLPTLAEGAKAVAAAMVERRTAVFMMISFESSGVTFIRLATVKIALRLNPKIPSLSARWCASCTYVDDIYDVTSIPVDSFDLKQKRASLTGIKEGREEK